MTNCGYQRVGEWENRADVVVIYLSWTLNKVYRFGAQYMNINNIVLQHQLANIRTTTKERQFCDTIEVLTIVTKEILLLYVNASN